MTESNARRWLSPSFARGCVFAFAGLLVLMVPRASVELLRFVLAIALLASGGIHLWGHLQHRESWHGILRAILALAAGLGVLLAPGETLRTTELVASLYLAVTGLLALHQGLGQGRKSSRFWVDLGRGAVHLGLAMLLVVLPRTMFGIAVASLAIGAVLIGLVMVSWSLRHGPRMTEISDRGQASEIFWQWLSDRDIGSERRDVLADGLYFEDPNRHGKIVSYAVMLLLSTALASLAILQDSTAVVIGAMLVAPLMTPIMGCAAGLIAGWRRRVLVSLGVIVVSVVGAIGLAWILAAWIPALVPLGVNSQVLSRSSPTLLDMAIALAAGAAGAYATIDDRVSSSLTGVAIAVALVPPLGVVGITLEAGLWVEALGAFLLFATNLVSIILASSVVFLLTGTSPLRKGQEGRVSNADVFTMVAIVALLIMVPLGLTGKDVLTSMERTQSAQSRVVDWLGPDSTMQVLKVKARADTVEIVVSGSGDLPEVADLEEALSRAFGSPVKVRVEHFPSYVITSSNQGTAAENVDE